MLRSMRLPHTSDYVEIEKLKYSIISDFITIGDNEEKYFLVGCVYYVGRHFVSKYRIPEDKSTIMYYDDCRNNGYAKKDKQIDSFTYYKHFEQGENGPVYLLAYIKLATLTNEIRHNIYEMMNINELE